VFFAVTQARGPTITDETLVVWSRAAGAGLRAVVKMPCWAGCVLSFWWLGALALVTALLYLGFSLAAEGAITADAVTIALWGFGISIGAALLFAIVFCAIRCGGFG
jgi:hypothetical protein